MTQPAAHHGEEDEMLEAGVEVRLLIQGTHMFEVGVVDVGIHSEQALVDRLGHVL
jgi:hypothetical protein